MSCSTQRQASTRSSTPGPSDGVAPCWSRRQRSGVVEAALVRSAAALSTAGRPEAASAATMRHRARMRAPSPLPPTLLGRPFSTEEARAAGVSRARTRSSDLRSPFHAVRSPSVDSVHDLARAYATRMRPHHAFGGVTAARLWGLPLPYRWTPGEPLVVARPAGTTRGRATGTKHIEVDGRRLGITTHHALRLLTPEATALTLARELGHEALVHVADALLTPSRRYPGLDLRGRPHATAETLRAFVATCTGLRGAAQLSAALDDARAGVDSRLETVTRRLIVLAGLPEPLVHPIVVVDGIELHPDLGYPRWKIAIEYEGGEHLHPDQIERDIQRYELLAAAGWFVIRLTKADVLHHPERCVRRVRVALERLAR